MERVLVIDTPEIGRLLYKDGLITEDTGKIFNMVFDRHYYYDRGEAEGRDSVKQIIPYAVLRRAGEIYVLERLKKQTEKRLHGKLSIGIGGHINPDAENSENPIEYGLYKELHEEVLISSVDRVKYIGVINDTSTPVSLCHLGFFYEIWTNDEVTVLETEKMRGAWLTLGKARELYGYMETWSQIALDYICG